jgi:hypothetical protein
MTPARADRIMAFAFLAATAALISLLYLQI